MVAAWNESSVNCSLHPLGSTTKIIAFGCPTLVSYTSEESPPCLVLSDVRCVCCLMSDVCAAHQLAVKRLCTDFLMLCPMFWAWSVHIIIVILTKLS